MAQLADALDAWLRDEEPRARRLPWLVGAAVVALLAVLIPLGVKQGWFGAGPVREPDGGPKGEQVRQGGPVAPGDRPELPKVAASPVLPETQRLIAVGFSPAGDELYTATAVGEVQVAIRRWEVATGRDRSGDVTPEKHEWATFAPGGRFVMGGGGNGIELAAVATGQTEKYFPVGSHATAAAVTRDGRRLIGGFQEALEKHLVQVWEVGTGRRLGEYAGHQDDVRAVALSDDGRWAYSMSPDREAVWAVGAKTPMHESGEHTARCADFLPASDRLLIGSRHGDLRVYSAAANAQLIRFDGQHDGPVTCLAASSSGQLAVSGGADRTVRVWDVATGKQRWKLEGHTGPVTGVAVSPDGRRVASCAADHTWRVWDLP